MACLQYCPHEILNVIISYLVTIIGIRKAGFLRIVSKAFDAAILDAICVSQVIDSNDPCTSSLWWHMGSSLRGKIALVQSRAVEAANKDWLSVIAHVNRTLDTLTGDIDGDILQQRHESIAETVSPSYRGPHSDKEVCDPKWEAQNLLSGAIIIGSLPIVKSLLADSELSPSLIDINSATRFFERPLTLAAAWGRLEIVRYLLNYGARSDIISSGFEYEGNSWKSGWRNKDWVPQADIESSSWDVRFGNNHPARAPSALRAAVLGGYEAIVLLLLLPQYRLSSSKQEYLAAIVAGARVGLHFIQILLEAVGKNLSDFPSELGEEMLWEAIRYDRKEVVQMLLENGVDINAYPGRHRYYLHGSLQYAASLGNTSMMRFLLERGADMNLNEFNRDEHLPIQGAARCGQEEAVEMLLDLGADPLHALQSAARGGQPRVIKLLLDKYPDLLSREEGEVGRRAIWWALCCKNLTAVTLLVKCGATLNEGYEDPRWLPINVDKDGLGWWVVKHLVSLGAEETDDETLEEGRPPRVGGVALHEHTWQWLGKY